MSFNSRRYVELLNSEDPENVARANDLWFEHRFGMAPDEAAQQFQYTANVVSTIEQERVGGNFLATHQDYPQGDGAAAKAMRSQVESLLQQGYPYDTGTLDLAYSRAVQSGQIKPVQRTPDDTVKQGVQADSEPSVEELYSMPMDKLEALVNKGRSKW